MAMKILHTNTPKPFMCMKVLVNYSHSKFFQTLTEEVRDLTLMALIMPMCAAPRAPPPPSTSPTVVPVRTLARREKSLWMLGSAENTRSV